MCRLSTFFRMETNKSYRKMRISLTLNFQLSTLNCYSIPGFSFLPGFFITKNTYKLNNYVYFLFFNTSCSIFGNAATNSSNRFFPILS